MNRYAKLKNLINEYKTLVVPDAYDPISAKIIEYTGYKAVQFSGYSYSIQKGYKDEKEISLEENIEITKEIVNSVNLPVMADGEDGYGVNEVFEKNFKKFLQTGIAGINIEDQNLWNINNPSFIVDEKISINKIKTAIKIKKEKNIPDFIINARTDALRSTDNRNNALNIAVNRANNYLEAGADLAFITYVKTLDEIKLLSKEISGPISIAAGLPYNINEFSINDCMELGIARVSLPSIMIFSSIKSMIDNLKSIRDTANFKETILKDMNILKEILK